MLTKICKIIIKSVCVVIIGLLSVVVIYYVGFFIFHTTYTDFCNLRGSNERWISQTIDTTDNTYRLGGIGNIGIGSTRQEIETAVSRRNFLIRIFSDGLPNSRYLFFNEPYALPDAALSFYRVRTWNAIKFLFDEHERVTKIRITPVH